MKLSDMINLSFLNIKSNKFKNIIYLLIMLVLFLLLSIVFTGTKSIYNFFVSFFSFDSISSIDIYPSNLASTIGL